MTEDEVITILHEYFEGLFPRSCPNCRRRFATLREYIRVTTPVGPTVSFEAELGDWKSVKPVGSLALVHCPCGSTMGLSTKNLALSRRLELLEWIRVETRRLGVSPTELLEQIRDKVRRRAQDGPAS